MEKEETPRLRLRLAAGWLSAVPLLLLLLSPCLSFAESVTLAWDGGTEPDIAGYILHYGLASGNYTTHIDVGNLTTATIESLIAGTTYYISVTAYDSRGNKSGYSNEVAYAAPGEIIAAPDPPIGPGDARSGVVHGYATGGASSSTGDPLQYRFQWGDGTVSPWLSALEAAAVRASKSWQDQGVYSIVAEARCALHPSVSATSDVTTVSVSAGNSLLLADSFSDGTTAGDPQWQRLSGRWLVGPDRTFASGSLKSINLAVAGAFPEFREGRLSTKIRLTRGSLQKSTGIVFSLSDTQHYRYVFIRGSRIYLGQAGDTPGEKAGIKASAARTFLAYRWYQIRVDIHPDGLVSVFLGRSRKPVLTYRFADTVAGRFGCLAQQSVAHFDDFRAWDARALP